MAQENVHEEVGQQERARGELEVKIEAAEEACRLAEDDAYVKQR